MATLTWNGYLCVLGTFWVPLGFGHLWVDLGTFGLICTNLGFGNFELIWTLLGLGKFWATLGTIFWQLKVLLGMGKFAQIAQDIHKWNLTLILISVLDKCTVLSEMNMTNVGVFRNLHWENKARPIVNRFLTFLGRREMKKI